MTDPNQPPPPNIEPAARRRWPLATVLIGGFGGLVALAVTAVLALGIGSGGRNTFALLGDNADLVLSNVEVRLRQRLQIAERVAAHVALMAEGGRLSSGGAAGNAADAEMRAMLDLAPDVTAIAFFGADDKNIRVARRPSVGGGGGGGGPATVDGMAGMPRRTLKELLEWAKGRDGPVWGPPSWSQALRTTIVGVIDDAVVDGKTLGYAGAAVSLGDLSRFLFQLYAERGVNAFVLYDRDHVLAHPTLAARPFDFSQRIDGPPLPRIDEVDDPPLAALWKPGGDVSDLLGHGIEARRVTIGGETYFFMLRPLTGPGPRDWRVGVWFPAREADREVDRLAIAGGAGLLVLLASVGVALAIGRRVSRSIGAFAEAARRVRALDFSDAGRLPDSRLEEIARAAEAFNAMLAGLRWLESYVPRQLVPRLMGPDGGGALVSEERRVTVMFTDIAGFSELAKGLSPPETQALLTRHFSSLADIIEAHGGTVDKFIGDAVMAFWGAPDHQPDHAARALAATRAIGAAVVAANQTARRAGTSGALRVRLAVHSGPVVVGNIGSSSRINYTIIGDTVNIAARLEEVARAVHASDEDFCALLSEDTMGSLPTNAVADTEVAGWSLTSLGPQALRGRIETPTVWRLASG